MHYNDVSTRKALYVMCLSYDNELKHQLKHCQQTKYGPITELQICGLEYISARISFPSFFKGVNHQTSHDGLFKIKALNISQDILNQIGGVNITLSGTYVNMENYKNNSSWYWPSEVWVFGSSYIYLE